MNDHFSPVGKPAPPRPRWPDAFISLMIASRPLARIALVSSQAPRARGGAGEAPIVRPVQILEDAILVLKHHSRLVVLWSAEASPIGGCGTVDSWTLAAAPGRFAASSVRAEPLAEGRLLR